jgi:hypothetical protein
MKPGAVACPKTGTTGGKIEGMTLCTPCQELYDGWLDYRAPARDYITLNNPQRSLEQYKIRTGDTRALVRRQLDGITETCRRKHQEQPAVDLEDAA